MILSLNCFHINAINFLVMVVFGLSRMLYHVLNRLVKQIIRRVLDIVFEDLWFYCFVSNVPHRDGSIIVHGFIVYHYVCTELQRSTASVFI